MRYQAWGFSGCDVRFERFSSVQEARTWAGQFSEWIIYEAATRGWRAIQHCGERGRIVAGTSA